MQEGSYDIQVIVKSSFSATTGESATATLYREFAGRWEPPR